MDPTRYSEVFGNHEFEFEDVDLLLKRDWFIYEEDLDELLWSIRQDVFENVFENRRTYPKWIYEYLECYNQSPLPYMRNVKIKIGEYTDDMDREKEEEKLRREMEDYEKYEPPPRPRDILDERRDKLFADIEYLKITILKYQRRASFYVKELEEAQVELEIAENEFTKMSNFVDVHNFYWKKQQWNDARRVGAKQRS